MTFLVEKLNEYFFNYFLEANQWTSIEIFGHRPPCRLDFAYCKMKFQLGNDEQNGKDADFMVIHGGMDTEGNIFDDLFFIHLT